MIGKDSALLKHDYVEFVQTFELLHSLIDDEQKKKLKDHHSNNLTEVSELKGQMEAHLSSVCADGAASAGSDAGCSSRMSCSESGVKAQLVPMKLKMQQDKVDLETRAAMYSTGTTE